MSRRRLQLMSYSTKNPVLLIIFKRPEQTKRVFDEIRRARPPRLYVAADGPRPNRAGEQEACSMAREVVTLVDWQCDVRTLFHSRNFGSAEAIPTAVDWMFSTEKQGVVLEDDCLPCEDFFSYCDQLLDRYEHDDRVWWINGSNFGLDVLEDSKGYAFSWYAASWGWASWRRAWEHFGSCRQAGFLPEVKKRFPTDIGNSFLRRTYWRLMTDYAYQVPNWDYRWLFTCWVHGALACVPAANLIRNIGFGSDSVHTKSCSDPRASIPCGRLSYPLVEPQSMTPDPVVDRYFETVFYQISPWNVLRAFIATRAPWLRRLKRRFLR